MRRDGGVGGVAVGLRADARVVTAAFVSGCRRGREGGESVIPGLKAMVDIGSELGIETYVLGMAHR